MASKSTTESAATGGANHRRRAGLKPVSCDLTPDVYELVYQAAHQTRQSMSAFVRTAAEAAARKEVTRKSGK